jgi:hypothetical protein
MAPSGGIISGCGSIGICEIMSLLSIAAATTPEQLNAVSIGF